MSPELGALWAMDASAGSLARGSGKPGLLAEPMAVFEPGFAEGGGQLQTRDGEVWDLPVSAWTAAAGPADQPMLDRCRSATLDVGCGPGRMTGALKERGITALGVDVSPLAVAMTRLRGASAVCCDIFTVAPRDRPWAHVLLVDGNVGIGGDPVRLLARCRQLAAPSGTILVDLAPPGRGLTLTTARVVGQTGPGEWFPWALLGVDALAVVAKAAGLAVAEVWTVGPDHRRWQAELVPSPAPRRTRAPRQAQGA